MKRGVSVAVIIAICALSSFGQSAVAEQRTPPPLPSGLLEQFKKDLDAFNFAMALRDQQISEINQSFYLIKYLKLYFWKYRMLILYFL
jgi:hypothetical protein